MSDVQIRAALGERWNQATTNVGKAYATLQHKVDHIFVTLKPPRYHLVDRAGRGYKIIEMTGAAFRGVQDSLEVETHRAWAEVQVKMQQLQFQISKATAAADATVSQIEKGGQEVLRKAKVGIDHAWLDAAGVVKERTGWELPLTQGAREERERREMLMKGKHRPKSDWKESILQALHHVSGVRHRMIRDHC